jgi:hypothetical protein
MSRIRSVHPGFFRDDRLVPCSAFARLLFIGLGVEADDKGIFEWKPVTIKMSVFPGDNVDVAELLAELVEADAIRSFEVAGKRYGAIRNFRKYQKPKTPNDVHPMADGIAEYVSLPQKTETPPAEHDEFPQNVEKPIQMEDGGGKREEGNGKKAPLPPKGAGAVDLFDRIEEAFPRSPHYNQAKAERAWRKLAPADQQALSSKAHSFSNWWKAEQARRGRSIADSLAFAPPLDKWIGEGAWRSFDAAATPAAVVLPVLRQGDPLIPVVERIRGKPIIFGTKGTTTVTPAELEQARAADAGQARSA